MLGKGGREKEEEEEEKKRRRRKRRRRREWGDLVELVRDRKRAKCLGHVAETNP